MSLDLLVQTAYSTSNEIIIFDEQGVALDKKMEKLLTQRTSWNSSSF